MPARPADEDFLPFDHPVRELPGLLADLARPAKAAEPSQAPQADVQVPWRLRVRRWGFSLLAATGVLFLILQLSGFMPEVFFVHMPLLAVVAVLVAAGTAERVPRDTPQFQNPVNLGGVTAILFFLVGGTLLNMANAEPAPESRSVFGIVYTALGALALLGVVGLVRVRKEGAVARRPGAGTAEEPLPTRSAVLAACRDALETIGRNAPRGARATGWLDLTGPEQRNKLVSHDAKGWHYRDIWWRLRLPWEDGVRLRLAGVEQLRVRPDGERRESDFLLLATLAVDPRRWRTEPGPLRRGPSGPAGSLTVEAFEVTPSRVSARVSAEQWSFQPADLIDLIKALEERIQRVSGEALAPRQEGEA